MRRLFQRCAPVSSLRLRLRREFVAVSRGSRFHSTAFSLQARARDAADPASAPVARFGFTVTNKVGSAPVRNRIRRRLREVVRTASDLPLRQDHDYVIVARREALAVPFETLIGDLKQALAMIHSRDGKGRHRRP